MPKAYKVKRVAVPFMLGMAATAKTGKVVSSV